MRLLLITIVVLLSLPANAQDTLSIYFDINKSKIREDQIPVINSLLDLYDLSSLDSVYYLGMADSVGRMKANLRLSLNRAEEVKSYCKSIIDDSIPSRVMAEGEKTLPERYKNRRVDIVLFIHPPEIIEEEPEEEKGCYRIAYGVIRGANIRTFTKRKREYVTIEQEWPKMTEYLSNLYYGTIDDKGEFKTIKVRWKYKNTGSLWWKKKRWVATIPKKDYDRFRIFDIHREPCNRCDEDFDSLKTMIKDSTCIRYDPLINTKLQYRYPLFRTDEIKVRVPREFVDTTRNYFVYVKDQIDIVWKTRNGNDRKHYFYTTLPVKNDKLAPIQREFPCRNFSWGNCRDSIPYPFTDNWINCGGVLRGYSLKLNAEIGAHYQLREFVPYAAIGFLDSYSKTDLEVFLGMHTKGTFFGAGRVRFNYYTIPLRDLKGEKLWHFAPHYPLNDPYWVGRLYVGTELKTSLGKESYEYLEHNFHTGISFFRARTSFPERIFLQVGIGYDFLHGDPFNTYGIIQAGVCFNFWIR